MQRNIGIISIQFLLIVRRNPWPFIMFPIILTALLSSGIFLNFKVWVRAHSSFAWLSCVTWWIISHRWTFEVVRGVHFLYAPLDAAWKTEEEVFHRNWAASDDQFYPGRFQQISLSHYFLFASHLFILTFFFHGLHFLWLLFIISGLFFLAHVHQKMFNLPIS